MDDRLAHSASTTAANGGGMKVFVPVSENVMEQLGLSPEDLVPFELEYEVLRGDPWTSPRQLESPTLKESAQD